MHFFQILKNFRAFWVFVLSYRANSKRRNDKKFTKPHFSGKLNNGVLFSNVSADYLDEISPKSSIWTNNHLVGNNVQYLEQ